MAGRTSVATRLSFTSGVRPTAWAIDGSAVRYASQGIGMKMDFTRALSATANRGHRVSGPDIYRADLSILGTLIVLTNPPRHAGFAPGEGFELRRRWLANCQAPIPCEAPGLFQAKRGNASL